MAVRLGGGYATTCAKCARPCWFSICWRCTRRLRMSARAGDAVAVAQARGGRVLHHLPPRSQHPVKFAASEVRLSQGSAPLAASFAAGGAIREDALTPSLGGAESPAALTSEAVRVVADADCCHPDAGGLRAFTRDGRRLL